MRRRFGITWEGNTVRTMMAVVTGEMSNGRKVWTECDTNGELVDMDKQYFLCTGGNWSEFVRI